MQELIENCNDYKFYQKNATKQHSRGRSTGGQCWIIKRALQANARHYCVSERVSYITINDLGIVGVYLPCASNIDNFDEYESDAISALETAEALTRKGYKAIIIGDFNCDPVRNNKRDIKCSNIFYKYDYEFLDILNLKSVHTFESQGHKSWIDHIAKKRNTQIGLKNISIINNPNNLSDHFPIEIKIHTNPNESPACESHWKKVTNKRLDFTKSSTQTLYHLELKHRLQSIKTMSHKATQISNSTEATNLIDKCISELNNAMLDTSLTCNRIINTERERNKCKYSKSKSWWDAELKFIHNRQVEAYIRYRSSNFRDEKAKQEKKYWKSQFRKRRRNNERLIADSKSFKLKKAFESDKIAFWKMMKSNTSEKIITNANIDKLKLEYHNLFNDKLCSNNINEAESIRKNNEFIEAQPDSYNHRINRSDLESIVKSLKNGKAAGISETTNEMFKYGCCKGLVEILFNILSTIINQKVMPTGFNVGIIKPIVKNSSLDPDDIANLRPIMISNTLANILESLLMHEINKHISDNNKQFGFKSNSSCAHAVAVLNM